MRMPRHIGRQQILRKRGRHSTPSEYAMTRHRFRAIGANLMGSVRLPRRDRRPSLWRRLPVNVRRSPVSSLLARLRTAVSQGMGKQKFAKKDRGRPRVLTSFSNDKRATMTDCPLSNRRDSDAPLLAAILATQFDGRGLLVSQDVKRLTHAKLARRADLINFRRQSFSIGGGSLRHPIREQRILRTPGAAQEERGQALTAASSNTARRTSRQQRRRGLSLEPRAIFCLSTSPMPGEDGYTFIRRMRREGLRQPVAALTALGHETD